MSTVASAGNTEYLATLRAVGGTVQDPDIAVEIGAASECAQGFRGQVECGGKHLADIWPHQQVEVVKDAGSRVRPYLKRQNR